MPEKNKQNQKKATPKRDSQGQFTDKKSAGDSSQQDSSKSRSGSHSGMPDDSRFSDKRGGSEVY